MENQILNLKLKVLTPVHIGAAQEKHLTRGVDYLAQRGNIYFLDEKKIIHSYGLEKYVGSLGNRQLHKLLGNVDYTNFSSKTEQVSGEVGTDIKTHIIDPLSGYPYIPGSSLKGALRSVLFHVEKRDYHSKEDQVFGRIQQDPFRYIQVSDVHFADSTYYNTKTFNILGSNEITFKGGWKHKSGSGLNFSPDGFTFPYQCIPSGSTAKARLVIRGAEYQKSKTKTDNRQNPLAKSVRIIEDISKSGSELYQAMKLYMDKYLKAEIDFFEKYRTEHTQVLINTLQDLKKQNEIAPVIRLGQGSGFHSITGNHEHPTNHTIDSVYKNRGSLNGKNSAKSRKLAFEQIDGQYHFYPMGFVQLIDSKIHADTYQRIEKEQIQAYEERKAAALAKKEAELAKQEAEQIRLEKQRLAAIEAKKPKLTQKSNLNSKKTILVDGVVTEYKYGKVKFKLLVEGFEDKLYEASYGSPLEIGLAITIMAKLTKDKKKLITEGRIQPK